MMLPTSGFRLPRSGSAAVALLLAFAHAALPARSCERPALAEIRISALTANGDIALADGRRLRPAGLARLDSLVAEAAFARQVGLWRGEALRTDAAADAPVDRWNRVSAWVTRAASVPAAPDLALTLALLGDGAGLADPAALPRECHAALFAAEAAARRERRGLWREPAGALIDANRPQAGAGGLAGRFVLLEGRVRRTNSARQLSFVDFGGQGSGAASLAIPSRAVPLVLPTGIGLADLKGRRVRARGVLEWMADRPYMRLDGAGAIEVLN